LGKLLAAWGEISPLVILLEDLHWADNDTIQLLIPLAQLLRTNNVLILGSMRDEDARAQPALWQEINALDRVGLRSRLSIPRLDAAASSELIRRCLGTHQGAPIFEARLYQETEGNPLFILETLQALYDDNLLQQDESGRWRTPWDETTQDYAELPLPNMVERTIAHRLEHLQSEEYALLQAAAVLGHDFDFPLLLETSGNEVHNTLTAIKTLVERHYLVEKSDAYAFSHDKIRYVCYQALESPQRLRLHRQAFHALGELRPHASASLAHHAYQAQEWAQAAYHSQLAAQSAQTSYANHRALDHYRRALSALERLPNDGNASNRGDLLCQCEHINDMLGDREAQAQDLAALDALAETTGDESLRAEVYLRRSALAAVTGDYSGAAAAAQRSVQIAKKAKDLYRQSAGFLHWGRAMQRSAESQSAYKYLKQGLVLAQQAQEQYPDLTVKTLSIQADCQRNLGVVALYQGDYSPAEKHFQDALALYRQIDDTHGESWALNNLGTVYYSLGNLSAAREAFEKAMQAHRLIGNRRGEGLGMNNLGTLCMSQGEHAQARHYLEQAYAIMQEIGEMHGESTTLYNLARASQALGDKADAWRYYQDSLEISRQSGDSLARSEALSGLALLCHHLGDDESAQEHSQQALLLAQQMSDRDAEGYALHALGLSLLGMGKSRSALETFRQAIQLRCEIDEQAMAIESQAGLVQCYLELGEKALALEQVEKILAQLEYKSLAGCDEPFRIYLTCYQALCTTDPQRATAVLQEAHQQLQDQASKITDEKLRRSFLNNVRAHRQIQENYQKTHSRQITLRLPSADAPTGRPLSENEWVQVKWTQKITSPSGNKQRIFHRREQLISLLEAAQIQGAVATVDELANILCVSRATIKRDLAALRRAGHTIKTRGSS
jgi:tetratricopeptide (TPR) repeat protein